MRSIDNKHTFAHGSFNLSTDYSKLWDLIQGGIRIPAWLVYTDEYSEPIWDMVEVKARLGEKINYSIGCRGIGYEGRMTFEDFERVCNKYSLHFINPSNE